MLTVSNRSSFSVLFVVLFFLSQVSAAEEIQESKPLSEDQKMEQIRGYFESEYQEEDYFRTDRLLLTATRRNTPLRKAPAIASVISQEEIRYMGARNLRDVLTMVPGIGVSRNEFGIFMYEVRGVRTPISEKILVMIDGHSLNKTLLTGSALYRVLYNFPIRNIKQIEVIRGPGSALYGANAFVAVINIITRDAVDISGLEVSGTVGSFDTYNINLVGGNIFANGLKISGSFDYISSKGENFYIEQDAITGSPFAATPGYANTGIEKTDIFLEASFKDFSFKGHYMSNRLDGFYIGLAYALTDDSTDPITNYWAELSYSPKVTDRLQTTFKAYIDYYDQDTNAELMPEGTSAFIPPTIPPPVPPDMTNFNPVSFPSGMIGGPKLKNQTFGAELQLDYDISAINHLVVGAMFERSKQYDVKAVNNFDPRFFPPIPIYLGSVQDISAWGNWNIDEDRNVWAVYAQDEWGIRDNLNLTAGVRYDHYSDFGGTTNPRVGMVWGILDNTDIKLLYGQAFRAPNFAELYNRNNPVNVGNPNLNPEKIKTYEVGTTVRLKKHFTVDLNYFYNDIEDLIIWDSASPANHLNAGTAEIDGVELILSGKYSHDNYWKITYTYQDPEDGDTGADLPYVPTQRATAGINYGITEYLTAHADILWTGSRPRHSNDPRPDIAKYAVVNLALTADRFFKNLEVQFAVFNLFDEDYTDPDTSVGDTQPIPLIPNDFPREGRSFWGELRYTF